MLKLELSRLSLKLYDDNQGFGMQWHCHEGEELIGTSSHRVLLSINPCKTNRYQSCGVELTVSTDPCHQLTLEEHEALLGAMKVIPNIQKLHLDNISPVVFAMVLEPEAKTLTLGSLSELRYSVTYNLNYTLTASELKALECLEQQQLKNIQQDSHPMLRQKLIECLEANIVYPPIRAQAHWYNSGEMFFPETPEPSLIYWQKYGQPWLTLLQNQEKPLQEVVQRIVDDLVRDFPYAAIMMNRVDKTLQKECIKAIILEQMIEMTTAIAPKSIQNQAIAIKKLSYTTANPATVTVRSCWDAIQQWIGIVAKGYHGLDIKLCNREVMTINFFTNMDQNSTKDLTARYNIRY